MTSVPSRARAPGAPRAPPACASRSGARPRTARRAGCPRASRRKAAAAPADRARARPARALSLARERATVDRRRARRRSSAARSTREKPSARAASTRSSRSPASAASIASSIRASGSRAASTRRAHHILDCDVALGAHQDVDHGAVVEVLREQLGRDAALEQRAALLELLGRAPRTGCRSGCPRRSSLRCRARDRSRWRAPGGVPLLRSRSAPWAHHKPSAAHTVKRLRAGR